MGLFLVHFLGYSLNSERKAPERTKPLPAGAFPAGGTVIFRSIFLKTLFFVYSNAFFEASLLSCCADNLLFTDAKHTDAVFHR